MEEIDKSTVYRVGGSVRDTLRGVEPNDEDYVVVNHTVEEMKELGFELVGDSFEVFIHPETGDEWALARSKNNTVDPTVGIEEDLARRDLTINAMAEDVVTGEIIDPYGGREDLKNNTLRHVGESFATDPHRVLRVASFASRLPEFTVAPETATLCKNLRAEVRTIAPNRKRSELIKVFNYAEDPRRYFDTLKNFNVLDVTYPVVAELDTVPAGPIEYHKEGSTYEHTMRVLSEVNNLTPTNERIHWAALGHDMGKILTDPSDLPNHPQHTKNGRIAVNRFCNDIKLGTVRTNVMQSAARYHMYYHKASELRESTLINMVDTLGGNNIRCDELITLGIADGLGREPPNIRTDPSTVKEHLTAAKNVIENIGGTHILDKFDLDESDGEKISDLILQERVISLKETRN